MPRCRITTFMTLLDTDIHARIGDDGFARLVAAFYRQVPTDDILGPMYAHSDLPAAEWRLREFLIGRFGGPPRYIETRGHPRLRMRHNPFAIDEAARDRWMVLMNNALEELTDKEVRASLLTFFKQTSTFLINLA